MTVAQATRPFWELTRHGSAPALVTDDLTLSYADLGARVADLADRLGPTRRLVHLEASNDVASVVGYLACLTAGHPVLVTAPGTDTTAYDPDVVLTSGDPGVRRGGGRRGRHLPGLVERRDGARHDLHPDLAVLLSTSGSTGSPKLVRLSRTNVAANATAIATALAIRPTDTAATTLPLHYCYGLSVLTSHLAAGAAVTLTDLSVVDEAFWDLVARHHVSTFPGVPHTFELLDRTGFADRDVPSLRYLTCAGGRLAPATVRRYAELGQRRGFDLFVMYGATEATARMAVLPADRALTHPGLLGDPVPGGSFRVDGLHAAADPADPAADAAVGELVFRGDNVMLGYATSPADLARGRDVEELRTGDLVRATADGLEVVGRLGRHAKVFGLRLDLDRVEAALRAGGVVGYAADAGDRVVIGVDRSARPLSDADVARVLTIAEAAGVPRAGCTVAPLDGVPRLASGKVDHRAIAAAASTDPAATDPAATDPAATDPAATGPAPTDAASGASAPDRAAAVRAALQPAARRPVTDADSFVTLGGDSLSYVETSLRLERVLGHLPARWHLQPVAELAAAHAESRAPRRGAEGRRWPGRTQPPRTQPPRTWPGRAVETNVLLRAAAIVLIVGSHANLYMVMGGAHLLLGLVGFNLARFHLTDRDRVERVRGMLTSTLRIVVPSVLWLGFAATISPTYDWRNVVLLNGVLGTREWSEAWHYWFVEALVWSLVAVVALLALPAAHRIERRWPFWFPVGLALLALVPRYDVVRLFDGDHIHRAHVVFWLFALGWAAAQATRVHHRVVVSALLVLTVPGFFEGQAGREALVIGGFLLLVWVPRLRVPSALARLAGVLASASLFVYLCHWQIYPAYEDTLPWLATGLSLAAGVALWWGYGRLADAAVRAARFVGAEIREDHHGLLPWRYLTRDKTPLPDAGVAR